MLGETEIVRLLLENGADVNGSAGIDDEREQGPWNANLEAVQAGHVETAKLLLERGADPRRLAAISSYPPQRTLADLHVGAMALLLQEHKTKHRL
jgi:ankyrin repeat protein